MPDASTPLARSAPASASARKAAYAASNGPVMQAVMEAVDAAAPVERRQQTMVVLSNLRGRCLSEDYTIDDYEREFGLR